MKDLLILCKDDINKIFDNEEEMIMNMVSQAYVEHTAGNSSLPHSIFLRFPDNPANRIIGLPAYLGGNIKAGGMKWISSFPDNINHGMERASAVLILNNMENGHVEAILESSVISAKRTAASAALAAKLIHQNNNETTIGFVGCGRINREIAGFIKKVYKDINTFVVYDSIHQHALNFIDAIKEENINIRIASSIDEVLQLAPLVSFATTAGTPYISDISSCDSKSTILNISLRDFSPEVVLQCDNIVDDLDHVCRERTSIHLTEQLRGNRDFVRCPIADIITNPDLARTGDKPVMFSPFGLGVLDLILGSYAKKIALEKNMGVTVKDFIK